MPRHARVVPIDCPLHVTHRGNWRAPVFLDSGGYSRYLAVLRTEGDRNRLDVWAYCLMPNHVHLVVVARDPASLSTTIQRVHGQYARWLHTRNGWSGHLWANRYFSTPMDDLHLWTAVRYVELNPVRGGLVTRAEDYLWSSARAHCTRGKDLLLASQRPFPGEIPNWSAWLQEGLGDAEAEAIRSRTVSGLPLASPEFTLELERRMGRSLTPARRGRPCPGDRCYGSRSGKT